MSKIFKIVLIVIFPMIIESVLSCCECLEPTYLKYTNCTLTALSLDNTGPEPVVSTSGTIKKEAYGIRLNLTRTENTCRVQWNKSVFIQSVCATSCDCPPEYIYTPLDSIVKLTVTTYNDFDPGHAGGSDVTDYFYVFRWDEFYTIEEFTVNLRAEEDYYLDPLKEIDLLLMTPPSNGTEHQFEVSIELSDGRIMLAQTGKAELI
jgi:hypothetical protein